MVACAYAIKYTGANSATEKYAHLADAVMASQLIRDSAAFDWNSFVRGYHVYCQSGLPLWEMYFR